MIVKQTNRLEDSQADKQAGRLSSRQISMKIVKQTNRQEDCQAGKLADRKANIWVGKPIFGQDRQYQRISRQEG